jgi:hypothetical protein
MFLFSPHFDTRYLYFQIEMQATSNNLELHLLVQIMTPVLWNSEVHVVLDTILYKK